MSHETEGTKNLIWSRRGQLREANMSVATINDLYMDTSFSGALQQCDPETCKLLETKFDLKPTIGLDESNTVRSLPYGRAGSSRRRRLTRFGPA